jgi:hypothetical protein
MQIMTRLGRLSFVGATTVFGTPADISLEEIALEMLYPADAHTDDVVRRASRTDLRTSVKKQSEAG